MTEPYNLNDALNLIPRGGGDGVSLTAVYSVTFNGKTYAASTPDTLELLVRMAFTLDG